MAKSIVFCADGTWNGPGNALSSDDIDSTTQQDQALCDAVTNVVKLFANLAGHVTPETLALKNETEKAYLDDAGNTLQISKYLHGVGDSSNLIAKVLGGVFGAGVIARIVRGYTFISRNYVPGDKIHIVGFSRGAYTARALAGMISRVGLLNPAKYDSSNRAEAYLRGFGAWVKCKAITFAGKGELTSLLTAVTTLAEDLISRATLQDDDLISGVRIGSVGVWDTVGSMGIPAYVQNKRQDLFSFVDLKLSAMIDRGFHAMALDERRLDFPVTRWDPNPAVEQLWFVGAHSDVGGGYPAGETGLSDLALSWMLEKLAGNGALFAAPLICTPDLTHFSQDYHRPWEKPPFNIDPCPRTPLKDDIYHPSVMQHWTACVPYRTNWPDGFPACAAAGAATELA